MWEKLCGQRSERCGNSHQLPRAARSSGQSSAGVDGEAVRLGAGVSQHLETRGTESSHSGEGVGGTGAGWNGYVDYRWIWGSKMFPFWGYNEANCVQDLEVGPVGFHSYLSLALDVYFWANCILSLKVIFWNRDKSTWLLRRCFV